MNRFFTACFFVFLAVPLTAQSLRAVRVAKNITRPTDLKSPPGDTSRLFVVEGRLGVRIIKDGVLLPTPFLDLSDDVADGSQAIGSIAFHPDYATNGRFFVLYVDKRLVAHVAEYHVSADPDIADPTSRAEILGPYQQTTLVHLWNQIQFGPDGMLYVAIGDDTWSDDPLPNYSQDLSNLLGKILRLDVDAAPPYIPADNPFVGKEGVREEIWMWGLRQPWRFSFDALTSDVFIADVGSTEHEELNYVSAASASGANFGWRCVEGTTCKDFSGCISCEDSMFLAPIYEYDHSESRCAIIGGYVYRGEAMPWLHGTYFFADYCSGRIWTTKYDGNTMTEFQDRTDDLAPYRGEGVIGLISSFGIDAQGEVYILDNQGEVFKIIEENCEVSNYCHTSPNSAGEGATIGNVGSVSIAEGDFALTVAGAIPKKFGMFFYGDHPDGALFGDGFRCVRRPIYRLEPVIQLDGQGAGSVIVDFQNPPQSQARILPGSTWYFQFWFRDPFFGGSHFNTTNGLSASFCP